MTSAAAERLVWQMALEIQDGAVVATGVASPLAVLAIALAKATHAPRLTYLSCVGSLNPAITRLMGSSEDLSYLTGRSGEISIVELFDHARCGRVDNVFFGAVEVDGRGRTNLTAAGPLARPTAKFPGVVGACSLRRWAKHPVLMVPRHTRRCLVPEVNIRSTQDDSRRTRLLTDVAVFSVGPGGAILEALVAGTSLADVQDRTGFPFVVDAHLAVIGDPPPAVRQALQALDPDRRSAELVGAAA
jgi:glutaconate CoA-transferase subunit B